MSIIGRVEGSSLNPFPLQIERQGASAVSAAFQIHRSLTSINGVAPVNEKHIFKHSQHFASGGIAPNKDQESSGQENIIGSNPKETIVSVAEGIFSTSQERAFQPTVLSNENVYTALRYRQSEPSQDALRTSLQGFFSKTVTEVNNPRAWAPGEPRAISDESRAKIPLPETHILQEEDGSFSYEFVLSPNLRIITGSQENQDGLSYPLKHVLIGNNTGQLLDLMSFRTRGNVPYSFSFSGVLPYGGSEVFLSLDTLQEGEKHIGWDSDDFKYRFVHEDGHASLPEEYYQPRQFESRIAMLARWERDANALALQKTKRLNTVCPQAVFFDLAEHRKWIENQLKHRYDDLNHVAYRKRFDVTDAASNEKRKEAKARERQELQVSLANELILDKTGLRVQDTKGE